MKHHMGLCSRKSLSICPLKNFTGLLRLCSCSQCLSSGSLCLWVEVYETWAAVTVLREAPDCIL